MGFIKILKYYAFFARKWYKINPVINAANPLYAPSKSPLSIPESWIHDIIANMIPNDDKNSQIEVDFFIVKVYAHNLHQNMTSNKGVKSGDRNTRN